MERQTEYLISTVAQKLTLMSSLKVILKLSIVKAPDFALAPRLLTKRKKLAELQMSVGEATLKTPTSPQTQEPSEVKRVTMSPLMQIMLPDLIKATVSALVFVIFVCGSHLGQCLVHKVFTFEEVEDGSSSSAPPSSKKPRKDLGNSVCHSSIFLCTDSILIALVSLLPQDTPEEMQAREASSQTCLFKWRSQQFCSAAAQWQATVKVDNEKDNSEACSQALSSHPLLSLAGFHSVARTGCSVH